MNATPEAYSATISAGRADAATDRRTRLRDGRRLCYREFGASEGFPVIALHGTPGSRLKFAATDECAARLGLRIISPDRWAYGGTDAPSQPTLSGYALDIEQIADELGLETFSVAGISGGGPFAAAVAALLGPRVARLALISPVGPLAGAIPRGELRPFHRFCFGALPHLPGAVPVAFGFLRAALSVAPEAAVLLSARRAAAVDRALLLRDRQIRRNLGNAFRAGLAGGVRGPVIDLRLFSAPWDVELSRSTAAGRLWLGTEDRNVPLPAAHHLAAAIGAELILIEGAGHFWFSRHYDEVLRWLAQAG
jgi:pimeloyl-ACP methyl ester carboxylesterase